MPVVALASRPPATVAAARVRLNAITAQTGHAELAVNCICTMPFVRQLDRSVSKTVVAAGREQHQTAHGGRSDRVFAQEVFRSSADVAGRV